jgi:hypothetical protein
LVFNACAYVCDDVWITYVYLYICVCVCVGNVYRTNRSLSEVRKVVNFNDESASVLGLAVIDTGGKRLLFSGLSSGALMSLDFDDRFVCVCVRRCMCVCVFVRVFLLTCTYSFRLSFLCTHLGYLATPRATQDTNSPCVAIAMQTTLIYMLRLEQTAWP